MKYYSYETLTQIFIISIILGWTLRGLVHAGKEIWKVAMECMEISRFQKRKKPAHSLATQRVSKTPIYRG